MTSPSTAVAHRSVSRTDALREGTLERGRRDPTPSRSRSSQTGTTTTATPRRERRRLRTTSPTSPTRLLALPSNCRICRAPPTRAAIASTRYRRPRPRAHAHQAPHKPRQTSRSHPPFPHRSPPPRHAPPATARPPRCSCSSSAWLTSDLSVIPSVRPDLHRSTPDPSLHQLHPVPGGGGQGEQEL
jgi:hypothetical protein